MSLYVADLAEVDQATDTNNPSLPVGFSEAPDFGFLSVGSFEYKTSFYPVRLGALRTSIGLLKPTTLYLYSKSASCQHTSQPSGKIESFDDLTVMAHVAQGFVKVLDEPEYRGWIYGVPFQAEIEKLDYYDEEDGEWVTSPVEDENGDPVIGWWRKAYWGSYGDGDTPYFFYQHFDGHAWTSHPGDPEADPDVNGSFWRPKTDTKTLSTDASSAEDNGFTIPIVDSKVVFPLDVPLSGFARLSRVGILVSNPGDLSALAIKLKTSLVGSGSNIQIAIRYSYAIPDSWSDVTAFPDLIEVDGYVPPNEREIEKTISIPSSILTGDDPLFLWFLLYADEVNDFEMNPPIRHGYLYDFEILADGVAVNMDAVSSAWTTGQKTKLPIAGTSTYREITVLKG